VPGQPPLTGMLTSSRSAYYIPLVNLLLVNFHINSWLIQLQLYLNNNAGIIIPAFMVYLDTIKVSFMVYYYRYGQFYGYG